MDQTIKSWEDRSKKYGYDIRGVLPKSFPTLANMYLDSWMYSLIKSQISDISQKQINILDLGCGYGRLSEKILKDFNNAKTFGIDVSKNYVGLYNRRLMPRGKAQAGDIKKLPYKSEKFDLVIMVTTLMYLTDPVDQSKAMREIFRVLKANGRFVIIERNSFAHSLITLGGAIGKEISAVSFSNTYLSNLITKSGGKISTKNGIPTWTLGLPLSFLANKLSISILKYILFIYKALDKLLAFLLTPSLYIAYIGHKIK